MRHALPVTRDNAWRDNSIDTVSRSIFRKLCRTVDRATHTRLQEARMSESTPYYPTMPIVTVKEN